MPTPGEARSGGAARRAAWSAGLRVHTVRTLARAGLLRPVNPLVLGRVLGAILTYGLTPAAAYRGGAARYPDEPAIIDDDGSLTFSEVDARTDLLAADLFDRGIREGSNVALMARNHRGFIEVTVALSKLGANALYLNTGFAAPQLEDVIRQEDATAVLHDAEFSGILAGAIEGRTHLEIEGLVGQRLGGGSGSGRRRLKKPGRPGRVVILTSGTTGAPKGASRDAPKGLEPAAAIFSVIPLRVRDRVLVSAPLFHSWGLAQFELGLLLNSTVVLQRRFDPEATLQAIERHRPNVLAAVPVMIQRIMQLPVSVRRKYDHSSLEVVALSGSTLPGDLALAFMDEFGDVIYNLYGSTEVGWATIATPADLRRAPGTAGQPPKGTVVRLFDSQDHEVPAGESGRIFVSNGFEFEGYTGGQTKTQIQGLMSTGDVGRFDENGLLFVEGRDDEMIVSGGENVFPREVEDLLARHEGVSEAAVIGVDDAEFGSRLRAFVVRKAGSEVTEAEIKDHVRSNLARYKVPRDVVFIEGLPRNATGKVVKRELSRITQTLDR